MDSLYTLLKIIALLAAVWVGAQWYLSYRRLAHIPGPWLAGLSSFWLVGSVWRRRSHIEFYNITEKYGSVARIGPNVVLTSNMDLLRRMGAARSPYTRSDWYLAFKLGPKEDNVFSMLDEKKHNKRRAQMTNGYLGKENLTIEPTIDRHVLGFLDLIRRKYVSSDGIYRSMDIAEKAQFFTLDVIVDIATGVPVGDLENDEDTYNYLKTTADALPPLIMLGSVPSVATFFRIPFIAKMLYPTAEDEIGFGRLIGIARGKVAERFAIDEKKRVERQDMLQSFIRHGLNEEEAVSESLIQILAGSDTTATAIGMILLHTISTPRVYQRLQEEIDTAVASGKVTRPVIGDEEAKTLPYLQAVIREGLRIFPPGTGLGSKVVPAGGDTIDGVFLPAGTKVGVCTVGLMRDRGVFGQDVASFRPERWLEVDEEEAARMDFYKDWAFGYGKYVCLGKRVALIELNKALFELFLNFDWSLADPTSPIKADCYGLFVMRDIWVTMTERTPKAVR